MSTQKCETCRFFVPSTCRRYPPRSIAFPLSIDEHARDGVKNIAWDVVSAFVNVDKDAWCGEYQDRPLGFNASISTEKH